jgi:hypothetical protein
MNRLGIALLLCCWPAFAQKPVASVTTLPGGVGRIEGKEAVSRIAYTRLFLTGGAEPIDLAQPTLTVQCTQDPSGKFQFDMFVNFGGVADAAFYPLRFPATSQEHASLRKRKVNVTMEFIGETKLKPMTRQFEKVITPQGQLRYDPPSDFSPNREPISFYFHYLSVLPTLRISSEGHTATFAAAPLLAQIRNEPLCRHL